MKSTAILLIFIFLFVCCKNEPTKQNLQKQLSEIELLEKRVWEKETKNVLAKLGLKPLNLQKNTIRFWWFYGGGCAFGELYELNLDKSELKLYSYLHPEGNHQSEDLSKLEYKLNVNDSKLITQIVNNIKRTSFSSLKMALTNCPKLTECGSSCTMEYTQNGKIETIHVTKDIEKCKDESALEMRTLYNVLEKMVLENSRFAQL